MWWRGLLCLLIIVVALTFATLAGCASHAHPKWPPPPPYDTLDEQIKQREMKMAWGSASVT
jgi:hypothetical protein